MSSPVVPTADGGLDRLDRRSAVVLTAVGGLDGLDRRSQRTQGAAS
jgi:hypothetical protein